MVDDACDLTRKDADERSIGPTSLAQILTLRYGCFTFKEFISDGDNPVEDLCNDCAVKLGRSPDLTFG
jgi:hypothetical protein